MSSYNGENNLLLLLEPTALAKMELDSEVSEVISVSKPVYFKRKSDVWAFSIKLCHGEFAEIMHKCSSETCPKLQKVNFAMLTMA